MKQMSVIGINLKTTKWIVSESKSPLDKEDFLCIYECPSANSALQMIKNIRAALKSDDSMEIGETSYYLNAYGNYVVASMKFLEKYFDGTVDENNKNKSSYYLYGLMSESPYLTIVKTDKSLTVKRLSDELESEVIDFTEEYLGASLYTKRSKGNQITEAYCFEGLYFSTDKFGVLWMPAKPYQGHAMYTAYGCSSHQDAKALEEQIKQEESSINNEKTPSVMTKGTIHMGCEGSILIASEDYLRKIYGNPVYVSLVNGLANQGLVDKNAKQRGNIIDKIYNQWDEKAKKEAQLNEKKYFTNPQNNALPTFFGLKVIQSPKQEWTFSIPVNINNRIPQKPDPLPYPVASMELDIPKPNQIAPRNQSIFNTLNISQEEEFSDKLTEKDYLDWISSIQ